MSEEVASSSSLDNCSRINVELQERSYQILIGEGLLQHAGELIKSMRPQAKCSIVTDRNVARHHLEPLTSVLERAGISTKNVVLEPGEGTKSFVSLTALCETLLSHELERGDLVVALGGGVIGDIAGFAASILRRGVEFVQIPTSLLAQVDSSVGGKTGINSAHGKNLIGAFHQPILVLCDNLILKTLDERQFRAGYAEVVKYGLIRDAGFFEWLSQNFQSIFELQPEALGHAIETSCRMKAEIVGLDEKEHGVRALLNLGHTFGHGLEALTGYGDRLLHGEAIAIGMVLAFEFSDRLGLLEDGSAERVEEHFRAVKLPTRLQHIPEFEKLKLDDLIDTMRQDKKVERGLLVFILAHKIGDAFVSRKVLEKELIAFLREKFMGEKT